MGSMAAEAVREGAFGLSTGLVYPPGMYAETDELVAMAEAAGRVYASHIRGEGAHLFRAVDEAIEIGRRADVPAHVSHLKCESSRVWGRTDELLARFHGADDVTADQYPYTAGGNNLSSCIPPWAHADGKLLDRLRDAPTRAKIKAEMQDENANFESLCLGATPQGVEVVGFRVDSLKKFEGKRLPEIAAAWNKVMNLDRYDLA